MLAAFSSGSLPPAYLSTLVPPYVFMDVRWETWRGRARIPCLDPLGHLEARGWSEAQTSPPLRGRVWEVAMSNKDADSLSENAEDDLFAAFVELVPLARVQASVQQFFEQRGAAELKAAFANPAVLVEVCQELRDSAERIDEHAAEQLKLELAKLLNPTAWSGQAITPEIIEQEAIHAREELARHLLDSLMLAFEIGSIPVQLTINSEFQPRSGQLGSTESEWKALFEESLTSLLSNVALSSDDVAELSREYFSALRARATAGPIPIPNEFAFSAHNQDVVMLRNSHQPEQT